MSGCWRIVGNQQSVKIFMTPSKYHGSTWLCSQQHVQILHIGKWLVFAALPREYFIIAIRAATDLA